MATRTELDFHMRMSRRLLEGLRLLAAEREMTVAAFVRGELRRVLDAHQKADARSMIDADVNSKQSVSGTGLVPSRYRSR